jgi:hypothetical protein
LDGAPKRAFPNTATYTDGMSSDLLPLPPTETFDTAILARTIAPVRNQFSPELADEILRWDFTSEDQQRMAELSGKARTGELTTEEEAQLDSYVRIAHFVNLMQAKARLALRTAGRD